MIPLALDLALAFAFAAAAGVRNCILLLFI